LSNRTRDGATDRAPISGFGFGEALRADLWTAQVLVRGRP
jgi:hypothetical protein